ncbi:MAG: ice-binding family protein [Bacteroidales bacterium]|jgi:hypothetical protein
MKKLLAVLTLVSVVLIAGCKKDNYVEIVGVCPAVISTSPLDAASGVPLDMIVTATFNKKMNGATITETSYTLQQGATLIAGIVSYTDSTASFAPASPLATSTTYTATVKMSVKDKTGNALASDYVWTFSTGATIAPIVILTDPLDLATDVVLNKVVTATFSVPMDPLTLTTTTFTVKQGATSVLGAVSCLGAVATFIPSANLLPSTLYTATITTGAKNAESTTLANNYLWTFTTGTVVAALGVDLKTAARFGIFAYTTVTNNAGPSVINNMDVGISPGLRSSITGFPPATIVGGAIYAADDAAPVPAMLTQAKLDLTAAYLFAEGAVSPAPVTISGDQGGKTLTPGIYKSTSTLLIQSGDLTLDAQGDASAVWIFQIASDFTTIGGGPFPSPSGGNVILTNNAQAKNIYWQVGSSATIGDYTSFNGNILALTSITMNAYSVATGRMLAINGAVVMTSTNIINKP